MNIRKRGLAFFVSLVLMVLITAVLFAQQYTQPNLSWSGRVVTARNPNPVPRTGNRTVGTLADVQVCVVYTDGEGRQQNFYSEKFTLSPAGSFQITAPGVVSTAFTTACSVIFD